MCEHEAIGASYCVSLGQDVANLRFELGVRELKSKNSCPTCNNVCLHDVFSLRIPFYFSFSRSIGDAKNSGLTSRLVEASLRLLNQMHTLRCMPLDLASLRLLN